MTMMLKPPPPPPPLTMRITIIVMTTMMRFSFLFSHIHLLLAAVLLLKSFLCVSNLEYWWPSPCAFFYFPLFSCRVITIIIIIYRRLGVRETGFLLPSNKPTCSRIHLLVAAIATQNIYVDALADVLRWFDAHARSLAHSGGGGGGGGYRPSSSCGCCWMLHAARSRVLIVCVNSKASCMGLAARIFGRLYIFDFIIHKTFFCAFAVAVAVRVRRPFFYCRREKFVSCCSIIMFPFLGYFLLQLGLVLMRIALKSLLQDSKWLANTAVRCAMPSVTNQYLS